MRGRERGAQIGEHQVSDLEFSAEGCVLGFEFCYAIVRRLVCHLIGLSNNLRGMRPTTLTALTACAFMLVGCSATQSAPEPAATPLASAVSVEPRPTSFDEITLDTDESIKAELVFVRLAQASLSNNGLPEIDGEKLVSSLHEFCESGEPMDLTDSDFANEYIDNLAINGTCEKLDQ